MEISTLMVGDILVMLPSSKASSVEIGFLSQLTLPCMKYFDSIENWSDDEEGSSGMKKERWWRSSQQYLGVKSALRISSSL